MSEHDHMINILDERPESPITMLDVIGYNQYRNKNDCKDDMLFIVYRNEKGEKKVKAIKDPPMEIYFVKPEYRSQFKTPREYLDVEKTYSAKVPARNVLHRIYDEMKDQPDPVGQKLLDVYNTASVTGNFQSRKNLFLWPYTLFSDTSVEDYYWIQLALHYDMSRSVIVDKCFADIENDIYGLNSSDQAENMDPVNAITVIFKFDSKGTYGKSIPKVFTFLLRNHKRYPQQKHFEEHLDDFYKECHEKFDHQEVIKKKKHMMMDVTADYKILFYDTEQELLKAFFDMVNTYKPDFCEFWNMPYDMPKMRARMERLDMNPIEVMSDMSMFPKNCLYSDFHIDNRPIDIASRNSYIRMTSTTQYIDQMQNYAGLRKGRKSFGSNKLDNISKIELGVGKWTFKKGIDVTNACILDYWNFVLYNIRDVWCQFLIDEVTNDTMAIMYDMNQHNCPIYHIVKQTKYQKQIYYAGYLRKGVVPGNNVNVKYTKFEDEEEQERVEEARKRKHLRELLDQKGVDSDDIQELLSGDPDELINVLESAPDRQLSQEEEDAKLEEAAEEFGGEVVANNIDIYNDSINRKLSLPGGLVGNPNHNISNGTELLPGQYSKHVQDELMDMDYASEYPWAKYTRSLSRSTQYGRLIIPHKISERQNVLPDGQVKRPEDIRMYLPGAEFTADYISQDYMSFCNVWFNLPDVVQCEDLVSEILKNDLDDEIDADMIDEILKKAEDERK